MVPNDRFNHTFVLLVERKKQFPKYVAAIDIEKMEVVFEASGYFSHFQPQLMHNSDFHDFLLYKLG
jgi:hypothetical protein